MCMRLRSLPPPPAERAVSRGGGAARGTPIGMTPPHSPEAEPRYGTTFYSAMTKPTRAKRPDAPGEGAHRLVVFFVHDDGVIAGSSPVLCHRIAHPATAIVHKCPDCEPE